MSFYEMQLLFYSETPETNITYLWTLMEHINFSYTHTCGIDQNAIAHLLPLMSSETNRMRIALQHGYDTPYASLHAPFDTDMHVHITQQADYIRNQKPALLIVIGIGGSNLGTVAIHHALHGILYNETNSSCRFYCADTVDSVYLKTLLSLAEATLQRKQIVIINIVSKSGTTTETIANATLFIALLQQYHPHHWHTYIHVTTDAESALWYLARTHHMHIHEIPKLVGGRYSVLSRVGLLPLAILGVDIEALCAGARDAIHGTFTESANPSIPAASAAILFEQHKKQITIHDTFVFSLELESFGKWYRQLCAESLGKDITIDKTHEYIGITPTVSVGSTDLHSVGQLYLGGPYDKYTTFISIDNHDPMAVRPIEGIDALVPDISEVSLSHIMHAIIQGTQSAYIAGNRPFASIELANLSPYTCGMLLQYKMLEVMYLGMLLRVNPFDQPHVELYKQETRKILAS